MYVQLLKSVGSLEFAIGELNYPKQKLDQVKKCALMCLMATSVFLRA